AGHPLTYAWDLNGDGVFGDAAGVGPALTWAQLVALGVADGPYSNVVRVRVSDGTFTLDAPTTLTVLNAPPTGGVSGPASGLRGQALAFTLTAADPSAADQAAGFTFRIDWGDGSPVQTVTGPSGTPVTHAYAAAGNYTVRVAAADRDGDAGDSVT